MFTHFFSFPENMKIPFELSLKSLPDFLAKVTFLSLEYFDAIYFLPPL